MLYGDEQEETDFATLAKKHVEKQGRERLNRLIKRELKQHKLQREHNQKLEATPVSTHSAEATFSNLPLQKP